MAAGGNLAVTGGRETRDFPEGHPYVCRGSDRLTILSDDELFELNAKARESASLEAGQVACSKCGSASTFPALKCRRCGEYSARPGPGRAVRPLCQQPFPTLDGGD